MLRLRQGEGPKRTVLVSAEATGSLATALLGPVVQQVSAGRTVDVTLSAPFTGSVATCAGRAIDSSRQHPDVVAAWVQP